MWPEFKGIITLGQARCATEIIYGECTNACFSEAQGQLFIELMQSAYIREDKHLRPRWMFRVSRKRREAITVGRFQDKLFASGRSICTWWKWWASIIVITHRLSSPFCIKGNSLRHNYNYPTEDMPVHVKPLELMQNQIASV